MKWSAIVVLAFPELQSMAALEVGVSAGSTLLYGLMMDCCDANSQSAFPIRKPLAPSRRMMSVAFAKGDPVKGSINPQCSEICSEGQGYVVSGCFAFSAIIASRTVRWSDSELYTCPWSMQMRLNPRICTNAVHRVSGMRQSLAADDVDAPHHPQ